MSQRRPGPLFAFPFKDNTYRIIDGDTVAITLDRGWNCTKETSLRLYGLDTPESRTRRLHEKRAGLLIKELVVLWFKNREHKYFYGTSDARPKYAKRTVGRIWAGDISDCLNDYILNLKVAKPYTGGTKEKFTEEEIDVIIAICDKELQSLKESDPPLQTS
jgi:micrococcal nuclease